jgi:hypothetical protein
MFPAANLSPDRLRAANINPVTGLATDYLNHYNEVAMLVATLGDMPEMSESILQWRPVGYPTHFGRSGFAERGLAIAAWVMASRQVKDQFRAAQAGLDSRIAALQDRLASAPQSAVAVAAEADAIFADIARLGGVINGGKAAPLLQQSAEQDLVDSLFA